MKMETKLVLAMVGCLFCMLLLCGWGWTIYFQVWGMMPGLWSMALDQKWFGMPMRKKTWLLFSGVEVQDVPEVPFVLFGSRDDRLRWNRLSKNQRAATPLEFAQWLVGVARIAGVRGMMP